MFNREAFIAFFEWLFGIEANQPQPLYIPIEEERRRDK